MGSLDQYNTVAVSGSDQHWIVAASQTPVQIMSASQEQRVHGSIFNDSASSLYIKFGNDQGVGVSGSSAIYDVRLTSASYFELPKPIYQGEIWGAWDAGPGGGVGGWARILILGRPENAR